MKIGFCGTMSVGKTTLVNALKELPEFKDYHFATERSKYLRDLGIPLNTDSTLKGQTIFLAERCSELFKENIITDRTIVDVIAFTTCSKSIHWLEKKEYAELASNFLREYDHIFYISPDGIEIEDNGVRTTDVKYRDLIDKTIQTILIKHHSKIKNMYRISGTTEERIQTIKEVLSL
jgi:GTPase SAR1 family protein